MLSVCVEGFGYLEIQLVIADSVPCTALDTGFTQYCDLHKDSLLKMSDMGMQQLILEIFLLGSLLPKTMRMSLSYPI